MTPPPLGEVTEHDRAHPDPTQPDDRVSHRPQHQPDLALLALNHGNRQASVSLKIIDVSDARRRGVVPPGKLHTRAQPVQVGRRRFTPHDHVVFLLDLVARMGDHIRPAAVVAEEQQATGVLVEPSDGHRPPRHVDELHDCALAVSAARAGHESRGLVKHDVGSGSRPGKQRAADANLVAIGIDRLAEAGGFAVHLHHAVENQLF
jgi:hypothetical protein